MSRTKFSSKMIFLKALKRDTLLVCNTLAGPVVLLKNQKVIIKEATRSF